MADGSKETKEKRMSLSETTLTLSKPGLCLRCRKEYTYAGLGKYICEKCGDVFLDEYGKVREFVDEYGSAYSILDISLKTGVPKKYIDIFIKEGRFDKVNRVRRCKKCGDIIETGDLCRQCMLKELKNASTDDKVKITSMVRQDNLQGEMHYFDKKLPN